MGVVLKKNTITIEGVAYSVDDFSVSAKQSVDSIRFSDSQISQLENELAISSTARNGYLKLLNLELARVGKANG